MYICLEKGYAQEEARVKSEYVELSSSQKVSNHVVVSFVRSLRSRLVSIASLAASLASLILRSRLSTRLYVRVTQKATKTHPTIASVFSPKKKVQEIRVCVRLLRNKEQLDDSPRDCAWSGKARFIRVSFDLCICRLKRTVVR